MEPADHIRTALAKVTRLRNEARKNPQLDESVRLVKQFQTKRFESTYSDLIADGAYRDATRFFLKELYGEVSYVERDLQFSRIAGALQRVLPEQALATAIALAQLHALSEELDHAMAHALLKSARAGADDGMNRYVEAWRQVGRRQARETQLEVVLQIGNDLKRLTRTPGLRLMLRLVHGPATAAGLGALQHFLEVGFDTFAAMGKNNTGACGFLAIVRLRECGFIQSMFG